MSLLVIQLFTCRSELINRQNARKITLFIRFLAKMRNVEISFISQNGVFVNTSMRLENIVEFNYNSKCLMSQLIHLIFIIAC